jgi:hypothetical protein
MCKWYEVVSGHQDWHPDRYLGKVWSWRYLSCLHLLEQVIAGRLGRNKWSSGF